MAKRDGVHVRMFFMGDGVVSAIRGQQLPDDIDHLGGMIRSLGRRSGEVGCCGTCLDARGLEEKQLVEGAFRSIMEQFADWTLGADRAVTF